MPTSSRPTSAALAAALCLFALAAHGADGAPGACKRLKPAPASPPQFDGPGSFGPLHETLTLGCLRYVGSIASGERAYALLRDEAGTVHRVRVGDAVGERSGRVIAIDEQAVTIEQLAAGVPRRVRLPKAAP